jgi:hypothetical protein
VAEAFSGWLLALLVGLVVVNWPAIANAQDKPQENSSKPTASPSPTPSKLGTELDGPVIVHTDLITLTVTVTDTYGRYVSGLNKNAFTVLDEKQPQEITYFSDDDAPVSVGILSGDPLAGCGTSQAARHALREPNAGVTDIDISEVCATRVTDWCRRGTRTPTVT